MEALYGITKKYSPFLEGASTSRGIALASQNSLKTCIYSAQVILPGEDADEFEALLQDQISDSSPRNSLEQALVQDIAEKATDRVYRAVHAEGGISKISGRIAVGCNFSR